MSCVWLYLLVTDYALYRLTFHSGLSFIVKTHLHSTTFLSGGSDTSSHVLFLSKAPSSSNIVARSGALRSDTKLNVTERLIFIDLELGLYSLTTHFSK
jgi:hypothetical protein